MRVQGSLLIGVGAIALEHRQHQVSQPLHPVVRVARDVGKLLVQRRPHLRQRRTVARILQREARIRVLHCIGQQCAVRDWSGRVGRIVRAGKHNLAGVLVDERKFENIDFRHALAESGGRRVTRLHQHLI